MKIILQKLRGSQVFKTICLLQLLKQILETNEWIKKLNKKKIFKKTIFHKHKQSSPQPCNLPLGKTFFFILNLTSY